MNHEKTVSLDRPAVDLSLLAVRVIRRHLRRPRPKALRGFGDPGWRRRSLRRPTEWDRSAIPVTIGEFFGGLGLILGFLSRFSAASLIVIMIGAIAMVHGKNGFFHAATAASNTTSP